MAQYTDLTPVSMECFTCPYIAYDTIISDCNERLQRIYEWQKDLATKHHRIFIFDAKFSTLLSVLRCLPHWLAVFPDLLALGACDIHAGMAMMGFRDAYEGFRKMQAATDRLAGMPKRWNRCIHDARNNPLVAAFALAASRYLPPTLIEAILERATIASLTTVRPLVTDLIESALIEDYLFPCKAPSSQFER